jgi:hypothetical protein
MVRLRRGVELPNGRIVGESDRTTHLVPIPADDSPLAQLTALCGLVIRPGMADLVDELGGMPCEKCLISSPGPATS